MILGTGPLPADQGETLLAPLPFAPAPANIGGPPLCSGAAAKFMPAGQQSPAIRSLQDVKTPEGASDRYLVLMNGRPTESPCLNSIMSDIQHRPISWRKTVHE